ncbi:MAG: tagaturonate reductase [Chloroflexi bacterium]|nr:tagaturonate reductase [Chloroflexota bacterium]MCY3583465.1 tagaturonate reductase [Chloroflexota bacterium]MCY3716137.1 tagaturonate reductase [Chloroflexota bacterium]MDE2650273.1 tagaturonate reductase [Chloroflexota bacterium]MYD38788.1 tagaturonate reductase [Chloroflexota bacterium]
MTQFLSKANRIAPRQPERIVQFGGGNFLRGFVDWLVDVLNDEADFSAGIVLVKARPGRYEALDAQDGLFTTWLHGINAGEFQEQTRLIRCVNRIAYPYEDFESFLAIARQPGIRFIFSNTTEAGIAHSAADSLDAAPPATFPAKLTRLLYERWRHFGGASEAGCIIIPTELITDNATRLREIVLQYAAQWALPPDFSGWLVDFNQFCNTLVDRIIPGYPAADAERLFAQLGYRDRLLVAGEIYHSFIIEAPPSLLDELPLERAKTPLNVKIVADAAPYRTIKVRLLNGAHTAMVPLGLLLGIESVREAIEHPTLGAFIQDLIYQEVIPSVSELPRDELEAFARHVFDRFRNPRIHHRLRTISLNSASKVKERLVPSLLGYHALYGKLPGRLVLALAGFMRLYRGDTCPLNDDPAALDWFAQQWETAATHADLAHRLLAQESLWGVDLSALPGLVAAIGAALKAIEAGRLEALLTREDG